MSATARRVAVVGGMCGAALLMTTLSQVVGAQAPAGGAAVQAPAGRQGGAGRGGGGGGTRGPQNQVANVLDVEQMLSALPDSAPAEPAQPRRVLVLSRAGGFVHSSIPLAGRTIEALGNKTGAWNTVITFDAADINAENLAGYDAVFLASTTGAFLDDPNDAAVTEARKKALMDFVRGGKGLAGIHAATDSYHGRGGEGGTWPEFNEAIGGYFKWHWSNGTQIQVKVEDVDNPINRPFLQMGRGGGLQAPTRLRFTDEVYTFPMDAWHRDKVRVLTSIDYDAMPEEVKAQEPEERRRTDGDYALSYIQRVGEGRVFVELLGHDESIYKIPSMLEHILAGMQYVIGDLEVDDSPMMH